VKGPDVTETKPSDKRLMQAGKELRKLRTDASLSPEEVSQRTEVSVVRLSHIEDGMDPTLSELFELADAYGYTLEGLFGRILPAGGG
jgi:transcriptional regulator with XRE-family HTH domain